MSVAKDVLAKAEAGFGASLDRLFELLRIPSISTDPAHNSDCQKAADWLVRELSALGFAEFLDTFLVVTMLPLSVWSCFWWAAPLIQ